MCRLTSSKIRHCKVKQKSIPEVDSHRNWALEVCEMWMTYQICKFFWNRTRHRQNIALIEVDRTRQACRTRRKGFRVWIFLYEEVIKLWTQNRSCDRKWLQQFYVETHKRKIFRLVIWEKLLFRQEVAALNIFIINLPRCLEANKREKEDTTSTSKDVWIILLGFKFA